MSRTITRVHRSPMRSRVVAIGQPDLNFLLLRNAMLTDLTSHLQFAIDCSTLHRRMTLEQRGSQMTVGFHGGCLCGAVRYESKAEPAIGGHCHCEDCRKSSGAGHCAHLAVPKSAVSVTGEVTTYDKAADSGNIVSRAFCPACGAPVFSLNAAMPDLIFIRASSLDDLEVFKPQIVVYAEPRSLLGPYGSETAFVRDDAANAAELTVSRSSRVQLRLTAPRRE